MNFKKHITHCLLILLIGSSVRMVSQTCTAAYFNSPGLGGFMSFTASPTNTNYIYGWNFGNGTSTVGLGLVMASTTYTSNGTYPVILSFTNTANGCTGVYAGSVTVTNACLLNFATLPPNPPNSCNGSATVTSQGMCPSTTYTWSNGFGGSIQTSLCPNTVYTVFASNPFNCCPNLSGTVSVPGCNLLANFSSSVTGLPGERFFSSTTTGSLAGTTHTWNFGDGFTNTSGQPSVVHTYSNNGTYTVTLFSAYTTSNMACSDDSSKVVTVNNASVPCNLSASFTAVNNGTGTINFVNTSTGTISGTTYIWNYGDGITSTVVSGPHTYTSNGVWQVTLTAMNNSACVSSAANNVTVNTVNVPCLVNADFTHTVVAPGQTNFSSTSTGTTANCVYFWNFGDGTYGSGPSPTHLFTNNGAYNVMLITKDTLFNNACRDTMIASVNITGVGCSANAGFNLSPGNQPQYWIATPVNPWTVINAIWYWGDGSSTQALYSSHTYSAAGNYSICLTVTVSCGASDSTCVSSYLYRSQNNQETQSIVYVNVLPPALSNAIATWQEGESQLSVYPNPGDGRFTILFNEFPVNATLFLFDLRGNKLLEQKMSAESTNPAELDAQHLPDGFYFLRLESESALITKKLVIRHH